MKCAIMQPTFLPWEGYFNLMDQVDIFVFFDDVQLARRSWQVRNRILVNGAESLITVPLIKSSQATKIHDAQLLLDTGWVNKFITKFHHSYAKAPYKDSILDILSSEELAQYSHLADMNIHLIKELAHLIGINVLTKRSRDLAASGVRSDKLHNICQNLKCDTYVSPIGSEEYIEEDGVFNKGDISLMYNNYQPTPYPQIGTKAFIPFMSIIDLIANVGPDHSLDHIRGNY